MAVGLDTVVYSLLKKYTDNSIRGITGALAGKNCTIESVSKQDGLTTVTFKWTADDGTVRRNQIEVEDGTPIYTWTSGNHYEYGDLVIYASMFYRCITDNSDTEFDDTKWNELGSPDGNYDIVQNVADLPTRFTAADRKLYYVINDSDFYLWNGSAWVKVMSNSLEELEDVDLDNPAEGDVLTWDETAGGWVNGKGLLQYSTMPTASASLEGRIVQFVGETTADFINGSFYKCVAKGTSPETYEWVKVTTRQTLKEVDIEWSQYWFYGNGETAITRHTDGVATPKLTEKGLYLVTFPDELECPYYNVKQWEDPNDRRNVSSFCPFSKKIDDGDFLRLAIKRKDGGELLPSDPLVSQIKIYLLSDFIENDNVTVAASDTISFKKLNADIILDGTNDTRILAALTACYDSITIKLLNGTYNITEMWTYDSTSKIALSVNQYSFGSGALDKRYINIYGENPSAFHTILDGKVSLQVSETLHNSLASSGIYYTIMGTPYVISSSKIPRLSVSLHVKNIEFLGFKYDKPITYLDNSRGASSLIEYVNVRSWSGVGYTYVAFDDTPNQECCGIRVGRGSNYGTQNFVKHCAVWHCYKAFACNGEHFIFEDDKAHTDYIGFVFGDRHVAGVHNHPVVMIGCSIEQCYKLMHLTTNNETIEREMTSNDGVTTIVCIGLSTELSWAIPVNERIEGQPTIVTTLPITDVVKKMYRGRIEADVANGNLKSLFADGCGELFTTTEYRYKKVVTDELIKKPSLPIPTAFYLGQTYILTSDQAGYFKGGIYQCVSDGAQSPTYSWELISGSNEYYGTEEEWNALTRAEQDRYDFIRTHGDEEVINLGKYLEKVTVIPTANAENLNRVVLLVASQSGYNVGGMYKCVSDGGDPATYSWELIGFNPGSLGTAAFKNSTDRVSPNNTSLVESQSVYSAINTALSSVYTARGDITCAELTSDLLIADNVGNVYEVSDSGTTTALFLQGAGVPITAGKNVGVISAGQGRILFNLMANAFDLTDYQKRDLANTIEGATTVEGALGALSTNKQAKTLTTSVEGATTVEGALGALSTNKVDKVTGKGLSTNDYDNTEKQKVTNAIQKSQTAGLVKNDGTVDTTAYAKQSEMSVTDGTGADADKTTIQLKSGVSATVLKTHQDISGKADKVTGATAGDIATLDANGNLVDSGASIKNGGTKVLALKGNDNIHPADLNDLTEAGVYSIISQGSSHLPNDAFTWWQIIVITKSNTSANQGYCTQYAMARNNLVYMRDCEAGTWSSWEKIVTESDISGKFVNIYDYSMTGTSDAEADIKSLVDTLDNLADNGTYSGQFIRRGYAAGTYTASMFKDSYHKYVEGVITSASSDFTVVKDTLLSTGVSTYYVKELSIYKYLGGARGEGTTGGLAIGDISGTWTFLIPSSKVDVNTNYFTYDSTTGNFTAKKAGKYKVTFYMRYSDTTSSSLCSSNNSVALSIYKGSKGKYHEFGGSDWVLLDEHSSGNARLSQKAEWVIDCAVNETISVGGYTDNTINNASCWAYYLNIERVG